MEQDQHLAVTAGIGVPEPHTGQFRIRTCHRCMSAGRRKARGDAPPDSGRQRARCRSGRMLIV
jgi:hypothetical protein